MADLSIVVPLYNEQECIERFYDAVKEQLKEKTYEVIFVDDGSTDKTLNILSDIQKKDKKVKVISFQKNYGKSAALSVGFDRAMGDIIISMDADLQDDPREIPKFVEAIDKGYDVVSGWKFQRKDPLKKRLPSKLFNMITRLLSGIRIHDFNCGFKAYTNHAAKNINIYGELHRYIPVIAKWNGYKVGEIKVMHHERAAGKSKYGVTRIFRGIFDLITVKFITNYSRRPLHWFGSLGITMMLLGLLSGFYLFLGWLKGIPIGSRPLLLLSVLLVLVGLQLLSVGLLGEIVVFNKEAKYNIKQEF